MDDGVAQHSWFGPPEVAVTLESAEETREFVRQWQGFMTARVTLGVVMVALQGTLFVSGFSHSHLLVLVSIAYCASTVASRVLDKPHALGTSFNWSWVTLVGVDVVAFSALQIIQGTNINYTPLFALPILFSAVLGPLRLALGTAAGVTVMLLTSTLWTALSGGTDATAYYVQSALSGVGYFVIALLAHQLSRRLASAGQRARLNQAAANIQRHVNELVIESLPDGVLIIDRNGRVLAANPAARQLLGNERQVQGILFDLKSRPGWAPLWHLARICIGVGESAEEDVSLSNGPHSIQKVRVRTRLAAPQGVGAESLCVLFLQDLRALEARLRTEKLASMGRMSTAVAHEIRNPLAAISQANALLEEDLADPKLQKLTAMIGQNARRLGKIVDDILQAAHVAPHGEPLSGQTIALNENTHRICHEWAQQNGETYRLVTLLSGPALWVQFELEHLRRVLVNLLDNARRYAKKQTEAIQVKTRPLSDRRVELSVWSDGAPMEQSVERHLFEPFFSSESRSSGLGLYICRELCERHGATITYQRTPRMVQGQATEGNEFVMTLLPAPSADAAAQGNPVTNTPWQKTLY
ncbi:MAG: PAS domain-containing protein [Burkholderiales bacterium]|nr:PAS domain-containing protein [Burkholderiales bacterium]